MQVKLYAVNHETGEQRFERVADLADVLAFDGMDEDDLMDLYHEAAEEIARAGRYWIGGGAAQLFLAMRCN